MQAGSSDPVNNSPTGRFESLQHFVLGLLKLPDLVPAPGVRHIVRYTQNECLSRDSPAMPCVTPHQMSSGQARRAVPISPAATVAVVCRPLVMFAKCATRLSALMYWLTVVAQEDCETTQ